MIYLIVILGFVVLGLLFYPLIGASRSQTTAADVARLELEEEKELLLTELSQLEQEQQEPEQAQQLQRQKLRQKVRLAQVLQQLDHLPPVTVPTSLRPLALPLAAGILVVILALLGWGTGSFFADWRASALPAAEAEQLRNVTQLPALQAAAEANKAPADYQKLGEAAWQAKRYQMAALAYTQLLTTQRSNAKALRRTGFFLLQDQKMASQGLSFIARAAQLDRTDPEGPLLYGYALGVFGRFEEGLAQLKRHQQLDPKSTEANELIVEFQQLAGQQLDGALVYAQNCASCHGKDGQGGTAPRLRGSVALRNSAALRSIVLNGATGMPAFRQLEGQQLEALLETLSSW